MGNVLLTLVFWLILCLLVAVLARALQRSPLLFFVLALLTSPLVGLVLLLVFHFTGVSRGDAAENLGPYREPSAADMHESKAWELKMLLKRADALEQRGHHQEAMACLERFIAAAERPGDADLVRRYLEALRARVATQKDGSSL